MPSPFRRILLAAAAAAVAGCATVRPDEQAHGPEFSIGGSIAMRETGKPAQLVNFTWSRGFGYTGWEERIELTDRLSGIRLAKALDAGGEVAVDARKRTWKADSLAQLIERLVGAPLEPAELAGWLANAGADEKLPDRFSRGTLDVIVRGRFADGAPKALELLRGEDRFIVLVSDRDTTD